MGSRFSQGSGEKTARAVTVLVSVFAVAALVMYGVAGVAAYEGSASMADTVVSQYPDLRADVSQAYNNATDLQAVFDGTQAVGGRTFSTMYPDAVPQLVDDANLIAADVTPSASGLAETRDVLQNASDSQGVLLILVLLLALTFLGISTMGALKESPKLVLVGALSAPLIAIVLWCAAGITYAVWIHSKDMCDASAAYLAAGASARQSSQLRTMLPCPDQTAAAQLGDGMRHSVAAFTNAANNVITGVHPCTCCPR